MNIVPCQHLQRHRFVCMYGEGVFVLHNIVELVLQKLCCMRLFRSLLACFTTHPCLQHTCCLLSLYCRHCFAYLVLFAFVDILADLCCTHHLTVMFAAHTDTGSDTRRLGTSQVSHLHFSNRTRFIVIGFVCTVKWFCFARRSYTYC